MTLSLLQVSWQRWWSSLSARSDGVVLMRKLVAAYEEPQRKYHTIQHLSECISLLAANLELAIEPAEVETALWFHDAIYDVKANDNEARSAEWAKLELSQAGVAAERIGRIEQHILATRHAGMPQGQDEMLLVDIDLSIFGAPRARFMEYEAQVRAEYGWVPELIYREKRSILLAEFLARRPIYNTPRLHETFELRARDNLRYSIHRLKGTD